MATVTPKPLLEGTLLPDAAATLYTVPVGATAVIRGMTFCNTDTVDRTLTVHIIPSGNAVDPANVIYDAIPIKAGQTLENATYRVMLAGGTVRGFADVASKVNMRVDGYEVT